ncbi:ABC transporter substrate-binding protein [Piscinibacter gummiphilus]|uniref:ABC transporter substrate-binding protein n=2 Tax=Piscinibacter gummiphilus TaxID=946333 RepID=A0A1W6L5G8_9BURK|nr:ABC transporter substrate-binding protein [Piscinibacter gummiphilus]ATU64239.1 ABC transporter substrate-binding protein [Piscinibacter gummiphilus]
MAAGAATLLGGVSPRVRASSGEIVVGQSIHLSGPLAPTVTGVLKGQEVALNAVNARGGINGRKVRLITLDDAYDATRCVANCMKLIEQERVTTLFAPGSTANAVALLPILLKERVPLIGTYSGAPVVRTKHHPYFFTTTASYQDEVVQMLRNLMMLQRGEVGLVYQNNPFGQLMLPVVEAAAKEAGATLVAKVPLDINGADAAAAAERMAAQRPRAVLLMAFGPSMVSFVKAAKSQLGVPIYCTSVSNSQPLIQALGDDARGLAFTQVVPYPWRATTPLVREFHKAMESANQPVGYDSFLGYLNTRVLLEGLRRAGSQPTRDSVVAGMEGMSRVDLGGYTVDYSPTNHHGSKFVEITIVGPGGRFMK